MSKKKLLIAFCLLIMFIIFILINMVIRNNEGRHITFQKLLGTYQLDLNKTKLGVYEKDSGIYKNLSITFNADSTFKMNMKVPFMYDSVGKWRAGNVSEWCWLFFKRFGYNDEMYTETNPSGSQFTHPYNENSDTFFLINGATPREDQQVISDIYFKKNKE